MVPSEVRKFVGCIGANCNGCIIQDLPGILHYALFRKTSVPPGKPAKTEAVSASSIERYTTLYFT
jgi:hypothetical protein